MKSTITYDHVAIVLKKPRYPENIGAAARAMCNMGFSRLILVSPENPDLSRIKKTATHESNAIVDSMCIVDSTAKALESFNYVVGTTARLGKQRRKASTPSTLAETLVPISRENRIAVLFGPEDRGLENDDINRCDALIHIPTYGFSSINLAQAVMLICYELAKTHDTKQKSIPKLANKKELEEMYTSLKLVLDKIGYKNPQKPDYYVNAYKDFFSRTTLRSKDVIILRTLLAKISQHTL
ncbi:MAG: RNA methyltransferase [Proteobacteria bacterium]|nr:RNA methyltransferase [Pseudomonadota bacterium]